MALGRADMSCGHIGKVLKTELRDMAEKEWSVTMAGGSPQDLQAVISVLQTALTPAFLLVALGSLLNLFTGRLSRIADRSRLLQDLYADTKGDDHARLVEELRISEKRMRVVGI
ncbi:MAG: DUF2721 domain-containing protein [Sphingorhabdus sp.]